MKKYIPAVITAIVIAIPAALLFIVFVLPNLKDITRSTLRLDLEGVTRIELRSGFGMGFNATTETDPEVIDRITDNLALITFVKQEKLPEYGGWSYWLKLYNGDELIDEVTLFSSGSPDYNGYLYTISADSPHIDTDYYDKLLYTALPLDELLTYDIPFVEDMLSGFTQDEIVALYGEPDALAENGASVYHADGGSALYINYAEDRVSSIWIARPADE